MKRAILDRTNVDTLAIKAAAWWFCINSTKNEARLSTRVVADNAESDLTIIPTGKAKRDDVRFANVYVSTGAPDGYSFDLKEFKDARDDWYLFLLYLGTNEIIMVEKAYLKELMRTRGYEDLGPAMVALDYLDKISPKVSPKGGVLFIRDDGW
jgi:hypothetical protein